MTAGDDDDRWGAADDEPETYEDWISTKEKYQREAAGEAEDAEVHIHIEGDLTIADGGELHIGCGDPRSPEPKNTWITEVGEFIRNWMPGGESIFFLLLIPALYPDMGVWAVVLMPLIIAVAIT